MIMTRRQFCVTTAGAAIGVAVAAVGVQAASQAPKLSSLGFDTATVTFTPELPHLRCGSWIEINGELFMITQVVSGGTVTCERERPVGGWR